VKDKLLNKNLMVEISKQKSNQVKLHNLESKKKKNITFLSCFYKGFSSLHM